MPKSAWMRSLANLLAVAALCAATAGCVSDAETALSGTTPSSGNSETMRYYGGPKSPMWSSNQ
jgi:hypothetical protein